MTDTHLTDILFTELPGKHGNVGEISLNRPKALNALTFDMCKRLEKQLLTWQSRDDIKAVIIRSTNKKAFCAGGDIRYLYEHRDNERHWVEFFRLEYTLNKIIHHYSKPYIALLNGITMGGGVGVSLHGSYTLATENFIFSMPEVAIGFFPDIAAGYLLNRCPDHIGRYLGLTGTKIQAPDAAIAKLISHIIPDKAIDTLVESICQTSFSGNNHPALTQVINQFSQPIGQPMLAKHKALIQECFSHKTVEAIIDALTLKNTPWSSQVVKDLGQRSPTSLKIALEYLQRSEALQFDQISQMDFDLVHAFLHSPDFFEGVRAMLIDKDRLPNWQPKTLADVSSKDVNAYFKQQSPL